MPVGLKLSRPRAIPCNTHVGPTRTERSQCLLWELLFLLGLVFRCLFRAGLWRNQRDRRRVRSAGHSTDRKLAFFNIRLNGRKEVFTFTVNTKPSHFTHCLLISNYHNTKQLYQPVLKSTLSYNRLWRDLLHSQLEFNFLVIMKHSLIAKYFKIHVLLEQILGSLRREGTIYKFRHNNADRIWIWEESGTRSMQVRKVCSCTDNTVENGTHGKT